MVKKYLENTMKLPNNAQKLIALLSAAGYEAYAVGGFVRDKLMGREAHDVDITTSATPAEVEGVLSENGIAFFETGIKHGTVTAVINHEPYEITTFRTDGDYLDNRRPENVTFVRDVTEDLARRDFTINAIAYNDEVGIVDKFGGESDIKNRIIRAVGDGDTRFKEDALRIMRALRFAAVLGFEIEEQTAKAVFENKELLKNIAGERIFAELLKLLCGDFCEQILLDYRDVLAVVMPELEPCFDFPQHSKWHIYDVYTHIVKSTAIVENRDYMRFAMLFHDTGKPSCKTTDDNGQDHFKGHPVVSVQLARDALNRFHASNDFKHKVLTLIENHDYYITQKPSNIKKWLRNLGEELALDYIDFKIADLMSHNLEFSLPEIEVLKQIKQQTKDIIASGEPYKISHLAINGNDLSEIGFVGKEIADELDLLVRMVSGSPDLNTREKLLHIAESDFIPIRKQNRLKNYDYSTNGAYFVTICTKDKAHILSEIVTPTNNNVGEGFPTLPSVRLTDIGIIVNETIEYTNKNTPFTKIVNYVIMPNHIHMMIDIDKGIMNDAGGLGNPPLQEIVRRIKTYTSRKSGHHIWQRSFHDHIIRNEEDYLLHMQYIDENPRKWLLGEDEYYC